MKKSILLFTVCFLFFSCKNEVDEKKGAETAKKAEIEKLNNYFDAYFEEYKSLRPEFQTQIGSKENYGKWNDISPSFDKLEMERAKEHLNYLKKNIDRELLDEPTALSYTLFKMEMEDIIDSYEFRLHTYPVNQMRGTHSNIPAFLINMHKIDDEEDAAAYISRLERIPAVIDQLVENILLREKNGIVVPAFVFPMVIDDSKNILKGEPFETSINQSTLLEDFSKKINELELADEIKEEWIDRAKHQLVENVQPAYLKLIDLLEQQAKRATTDDGAWKFPNGEKFYAHTLKKINTIDITSEEIHQFGLDEVERIHGEMETIKNKVGFEGSLQDFFHFMRTDKQFYYQDTEEGKNRYITEATEIINTMKGRLDELFLTKPEADLIVKKVEPFREKSAGKAFYQRPAIDGTRPGTYYANLYDMSAMPIYQMEALAYHEGIPGHHMQLAIAQELEGLPDFRKFKNHTAYVEGWGLYSEFLPKELGFYEDPYSDFGRLAMELWRACRLVVDTGIHNKKWTRQQGIDYYNENTPNSEGDCIKMVERHIVMPGQATAYKIGMQKIIDLREYAKTQLGEAFDIREFHNVLLLNGSLPLNIIEDKVDMWIDKKLKA